VHGNPNISWGIGVVRNRCRVGWMWKSLVALQLEAFTGFDELDGYFDFLKRRKYIKCVEHKGGFGDDLSLM
jgi:hypothetical protein